jgi:hypothetical protein
MPQPESQLISQRYVKGTKCDLTNEFRSVEVRFVCNEKANGVTYLGELLEPSTCHYTLQIVTPLVCGFAGKAKQIQSGTIFCNPKADPEAEAIRRTQAARQAEEEAIARIKREEEEWQKEELEKTILREAEQRRQEERREQEKEKTQALQAAAAAAKIQYVNFCFWFWFF